MNNKLWKVRLAHVIAAWLYGGILVFLIPFLVGDPLIAFPALMIGIPAAFLVIFSYKYVKGDGFTDGK